MDLMSELRCYMLIFISIRSDVITNTYTNPMEHCGDNSTEQ